MNTNRPDPPSTKGNGKRSEAPSVRTQFLIFTLFGEYVLARGGKIWTSNILNLMKLLNVSERAVRSALSRMTRKKWISSQKYGRRSQYFLTARGQALLVRGGQRIFEPIFTDWDGQWHLAVYSLPETKRRARHVLRKQLTWLGFGRLAPGIWITPHDRSADLENMLADLDAEPHVNLFSGNYLGPSSAQELIRQCWDLNGTEVQYQEFVARHQPEYRECLTQGNELDPEICFVRHFWLTHEFQSFPIKDPNLPATLLPPDWIGFTVRKLFDNYRCLLSAHANQYVDDVMASDNGLPSAGSGD